MKSASSHELQQSCCNISSWPCRKGSHASQGTSTYLRPIFFVNKTRVPFDRRSLASNFNEHPRRCNNQGPTETATVLLISPFGEKGQANYIKLHQLGIEPFALFTRAWEVVLTHVLKGGDFVQNQAVMQVRTSAHVPFRVRTCTRPVATFWENTNFWNAESMYSTLI